MMISERGSNGKDAAPLSRHDTSGENLEFYIFGHNISHSLSPALHNAGFQHIGFPGHYTIHQSPEVDRNIEKIIRQPSFGGASVTFPHKLQVGRLVDSITPVAKTVGAINTLVVQRKSSGETTLVGDNTDWSGIRTCILAAGLPALEEYPAIVWGAGGAARAACWALQTLGVTDIILVNRTASTAAAVASQFPKARFHIVPSLHEAHRVACEELGARARVVVGCVPADDIDESHIPEDLFGGVPAGILVEMAYRPPVTATMRVAARHPGWTVCNGMDVLKEQAFAQFELWTENEAPKEVMTASMQKEIARQKKAAEE